MRQIHERELELLEQNAARAVEKRRVKAWKLSRLRFGGLNGSVESLAEAATYFRVVAHFVKKFFTRQIVIPNRPHR